MSPWPGDDGATSATVIPGWSAFTISVATSLSMSPWPGDDGATRATVIPGWSAFGKTGSGGFSAYFWSAACAESGKPAMREANETSSRNVRRLVGMGGILGRCCSQTAPDQHANRRKDEQRGPEGPYDGRSSRQVELEREPHSERRHDSSHRPSDRESRPEPLGKEHRGHRGHDEEAEDEEHAGDRDRRRHDESEGHIEEEVPPPNVQSLSLRFRLVHRDQEELPPEDIVKQHHQRIEKRGLRPLPPCHREDVADEHFLQVLRLLRPFRPHEDGDRRRYRVDDADDRLLRDAGLTVDARHREDRGSQEREAEGEEIGRRRVQIVSGKIRDRRAESRDLREREVNEDDAPLDHVNAEIGVDSREDEARNESGKQDLKDRHPSISLPYWQRRRRRCCDRRARSNL